MSRHYKMQARTIKLTRDGSWWERLNVAWFSEWDRAKNLFDRAFASRLRHKPNK